MDEKRKREKKVGQSGSKSKTQPTEETVNESQRKTKKSYHEDCLKENKPTEKRLRYRIDEDEGSHDSARTRVQSDKSERSQQPEKEKKATKIKPPTSSLRHASASEQVKRRPRVEDVAEESAREKHACSKERRRGSKETERRSSEDKNSRGAKNNVLDDGPTEKNERRRSSRDPHRREETLEKQRDGKQERKSRGKSSRRKGRSVRCEDPEKQRNCYSDSEIEQSCPPSSRPKKCQADSSSGGDEKPIDVSALYNLFYREESKAGGRQLPTSKEKGREGAIDSRRKQPPATTTVNEHSDQSTVRGKLIRVLFKRVKDLLKETEKLRDERKEFTVQIEELSRQVAGLRMKEEEHMTTEMRIKERLNVIANDVNITNKGTTFREEVQGILNDIQFKYANHWQEHERNMQRVQTHAETQIQSLMKSIVGKYVQINEIREQSSMNTSGGATPFEEEEAGAGVEKHEAFLLSSLNEHLAAVGAGKGQHDSLGDFSLRYMKPLYVDTKEDEYSVYFQQHQPDLTTASTSLLKIAEPERHLTRQQGETGGRRLERGGLITSEQQHRENLKMNFKHQQIVSEKPRKTKEELKEFWRHKLLQPNPLETIRKEQNEDSQTSRFTARNQS